MAPGPLPEQSRPAAAGRGNPEGGQRRLSADSSSTPPGHRAAEGATAGQGPSPTAPDWPFAVAHKLRMDRAGRALLRFGKRPRSRSGLSLEPEGRPTRAPPD